MSSSHKVVVIGAGCAGMRAAIAAHDSGADVAVVSKLHPTRSHSGASEGGINAALGNAGDDSPESHAFDTVKGSDYLGDQDSIESSHARRPATSSSSRTGARSSHGMRTGASPSARSAPPARREQCTPPTLPATS
jgi:succinate dehydrogenase / fumarate reductase flavoprotein subunit